jgi:DNA invertase Pin-like site-specific DNA recombinase
MQQPIKRRKNTGPVPLVSYRRLSKDELTAEERKEQAEGIVKTPWGLIAQQHEIKIYADAHGLTVAADFWEIVSGAEDDRPEYEKAIELCKQMGYTLIVSRLDRLSRRVSVISQLMEGKPNFICLDAPNGSNLQLHLYAAFAEHERQQISLRTRAALARVKEKLNAEGKRLGAPDQRANYSTVLIAQATAAEEFRRTVRPRIQEMRVAGATFQQIADVFNQEHFPTPSGKGRWSGATVFKAQQIPRGLDLAPAFEAGTPQPANSDGLPLFETVAS